MHHERTRAEASMSREYHGSDRRSVVRGVGVPGPGLVLWGVGGFASALAATVAIVTVAPGQTIDLWPVALAFWCTTTIGSGVALLVSWRVGGWARPGQLGTALVALALFVSLLPRFSELVAPIDRLHAIRPLGTTVILLTAGAYVMRAVRRPDVDTAVRPIYDLGALLLLMTFGVLASVTVLLLANDAVQHAIEWGPAVACLLGAGAVVVAEAGRRTGRATARCIAVALLLMSVASALHHGSQADLTQATAAAAMCTASLLFAAIARVRLRAALAMQEARSLQTLATLGQYSSQVSRERERRHDALNALAAIRSAADVLTTRGQTLDLATRAELSLAARTELARVERMLALSAAAAPQGMLLREVLRPVLLARAHSGLELQADLGEVRVHAVADIVARIVDNLLQNVERHAAGSSARISAEQVGDDVFLTVADHGPGMPAQRLAEVFERAATSCDSGHGLGLASARRLAQDQGGDLSLVSGEHGCCFRLTLPAEPSVSSAGSRRERAGRRS